MKKILLTCALLCSYALASTALANGDSLIGKELDSNKSLVDSELKGHRYSIEVDDNGIVTQVIDFGLDEGTRDFGYVSRVDAPKVRSGKDAVDHVDLDKVAKSHHLDANHLKDILLKDGSAHIDENSRLVYFDAPAKPIKDRSLAAPLPISQTSISTDSAFLLHSNKGASKTIYINFVGYVATKTAWSMLTPLVAPAYDLSGDPSVFDVAERQNIISIWKRVSEDYIPFDIDVTTEPPTSDALVRTTAADTTYGTMVVVTKTNVIGCVCGGVSFVGMVNFINNTTYTPSWVFQQSLANNEKYIGEAVSHEAGHTLGLSHEGQTNSAGVLNAYYYGHGTGNTSWGPIMGAGYYVNVTDWSIGDYTGANNQQDELTTIASKGIAYRADDVADSNALSTPITQLNGVVNTFGAISTNSDIDVYKIDAKPGTLNLTVSPVATGPNLDTAIILYDSKGAIVASNAPANVLTSNVNVTTILGTYYLAVTNSGRAQASATDFGYSKYGSMGQYVITGNYVNQ